MAATRSAMPQSLPEKGIHKRRKRATVRGRGAFKVGEILLVENERGSLHMIYHTPA